MEKNNCGGRPQNSILISEDALRTIFWFVRTSSEWIEDDYHHVLYAVLCRTVVFVWRGKVWSFFCEGNWCDWRISKSWWKDKGVSKFWIIRKMLQKRVLQKRICTVQMYTISSEGLFRKTQTGITIGLALNKILKEWSGTNVYTIWTRLLQRSKNR